MEEQCEQPAASCMLPLLVPLSLIAVVVVGGFLIVGGQVASLETGSSEEVRRLSTLEEQLRARDERIARLTAAYTELWVRATAAEQIGRSRVAGLTIMGCDHEGNSFASLKEIEYMTSIVERQTRELLAQMEQLRMKATMKKAVRDHLQGVMADARGRPQYR